MTKQTEQRTVKCYLCQHSFNVGSRAMSVSCPNCHKPVLIENIVVKNYRPVKKLQTCGKLIIRKGGRVAAEIVEAHMGLEVFGSLEANQTLSGGTVLIGAKALWKSDCHAPSLIVKSGATLRGGYFSIPDDPLNLNNI